MFVHSVYKKRVTRFCDSLFLYHLHTIYIQVYTIQYSEIVLLINKKLPELISEGLTVYISFLHEKAALPCYVSPQIVTVKFDKCSNLE